MAMKIGIVGAGASGLYSALLLAKKHPDWSIVVFDKELKAGRKILATGNGHCNLLSADLESRSFNNEKWIAHYVNKYYLYKLPKTLDSFSIYTQQVGSGIYPLTYSAKSFLELLLSLLSKEGVTIKTGEKVLDYKNGEHSVSVETDKGKYEFDFLFICVGGKSSPNLGSDGSFYEILRKHGYQIEEPLPGLSPMKVKERSYVKPLSGLRHECTASLYKDGCYMTKEDGEVLFKDDGLSGICIFNLHSYILRQRERANFVISLDLFPNLNLLEKLQVSYDDLHGDFLDPFLQKPLQKEVLRQLGRNDIDRSALPLLEKTLHELSYHYDAPYPFNNSQVTIGGVKVDEVDHSLRSKKERNVFLLGEVLDVDGVCGGNNLSWALISALVVTEAL